MSDATMSPNAEKVYRYMKEKGFIGEDKMKTAEVIAHPSLKLAKNNIMTALQELMNKGIVKRKAREKSAGYYIIEGK